MELSFYSREGGQHVYSLLAAMLLPTPVSLSCSNSVYGDTSYLQALFCSGKRLYGEGGVSNQSSEGQTVLQDEGTGSAALDSLPRSTCRSMEHARCTEYLPPSRV